MLRLAKKQLLNAFYEMSIHKKAFFYQTDKNTRKWPRPMKLLFCGALIFLFVVNSCLAQDTMVKHYTKKEIMAPMRDGVKLFTRIYTPDSVTGPFPILIMRTPYDDWNDGLDPPNKDSYVWNMAKEGYIFVYQYIRGKQKSEGEFDMNAVFDKHNPNEIDEASDTYDLIDWLLKNVPSNGKVGQLGISYPGGLTLISAVKPHPALKAASPQGTEGDPFFGDDYFHNGAFRLAYSFEYTYMEETFKGDTLYQFNQYDLFDWYLNLGPESNVNKKYFHGTVPTWNAFTQHPNYDEYWQDPPVKYADTPLIPILHVGGYWDQENSSGPELLYNKMEKYDTKDYNHIVLGPWFHGEWSDSDASHTGSYKMGRNTADDFREIQKQWFDYWLKGKGDGKFAKAECFQTGSNVWKKYDSWPDTTAKPTMLYLQDHKKLGFKKPTGDNAFDSYVSDPANPVVYRKRPIESTYSDSSHWESWLVEDQRFVDHRPDVLSYETDTLDADVTVTGNVIAHLYASITGSDADWVVKLIDVYPDMYKKDITMSGFELMVAGDIFRGKFRHGFVKPEPIAPGKVEEYTFGLHEINHVFKKGHRIMVQIQSTWFPLFDRNPQHYVPNIFLATEKDYIKSTQSVYHSKRYATCIELPVVK